MYGLFAKDEASEDSDEETKGACKKRKETRVKICRTCGNEAHKKCNGCKPRHHVRYCNEECQRVDWPNHKLTCVRNDKLLLLLLLLLVLLLLVLLLLLILVLLLLLLK
jgi:hypothetical protein